MKALITAMLCLLANAAQAGSNIDHRRVAVAKQQSIWGSGEAKPAPIHHHHRRHHRSKPAPIRAVPVLAPDTKRTISKLQSEVVDLRRELDEFKSRINGPWPVAPMTPWIRINRMEPQSLPDLRLPEQPPSIPLPALTDDHRTVAEAVAYLIRTATPGYTMARQGPDVAIGRLHPAFAIKLAAAIKRAREAGLDHAGVFSAYRPPAFGVGGFGDKFNSLHSYGLAADIVGIGSAGSRSARLWKWIVDRTGLFLPYGPNNRAEFNHTQLVPTKVAARFWRHNITASAPKDLRAMWIASGVREYVAEPVPVQSAKLLPENVWP